MGGKTACDTCMYMYVYVNSQYENLSVHAGW